MQNTVLAGFLFVAAIIISFILIILLKPLLIRYALARPNARSSHKTPTPQGGGIAVLLSFLLTFSSYHIGASILLGNTFYSNSYLVAILAIPLALLGGWDDIAPLSAKLRFGIEVFIAFIVVYYSISQEIRLFPSFIPLLLERIFLTFAAVWFINLVNFMDGIDWITISELVPVLLFIYIFMEVTGATEHSFFALCLLGALIGFAYFNKPVAKLFLGDIGALPLGLLVGYLLLHLAQSGALVSALLLPLYYLCDASITLIRRFFQKKKVWEAHREHYYQKATDNGWTIIQIDGIVFILNLILGFLALLSFFFHTVYLQIFWLLLGFISVFSVLYMFSHKSFLKEKN